MSTASVLTAVAVVLFALHKQIARLLAFLVVRKVARGVLEEVGRTALAQTQPVVTLRPDPGYVWANPGIQQKYVRPLVGLGFTNVGIFSVQQMPGVQLQILVDEQHGVHASVYEHPQAGAWLELVTRYQNNDVFSLTNLRPTGIDRPSWLTAVEVDPATPAAAMVQRMLEERKDAPVRPAVPAHAVEEFEAGYARFMAWKNKTGISAQEVARQIERRAGTPVA